MDCNNHLSIHLHSYYSIHPTNTAVLTNLLNIRAHFDNFSPHWDKQRKLLEVGGDCPETLTISVPPRHPKGLVNR